MALFFSVVLYLPLFLLYLGVIEEGNSWYAPTKVEPGIGEDTQRNSLESKDEDAKVEFRTKSAKLWTAIAYASEYLFQLHANDHCQLDTPVSTP